jgi:hypothetical protein
VASRTQILCLCEGQKGDHEKDTSIDLVFINKLIKSLDKNWLRSWRGSNTIRLRPCGGRAALIAKVPDELRSCLGAGADTTLMVWADCDHDCADGEALKARFWEESQRQGITREQFDRIVFVFAKDRLENWIEFLETGKTDESNEGPRVKRNRTVAVANAAKMLAEFCKAGKPVDDMPPSLQWSCKNWQALVKRMK